MPTTIGTALFGRRRNNHPGGVPTGINTNYGDTARFSGITIISDTRKKISICDKYPGNNTGAEPPKCNRSLPTHGAPHPGRPDRAVSPF
jgi:hypothetical protein